MNNLARKAEYVPPQTFGRPSKYRPEYCQQMIEFFQRPLTHTKIKTYTTKAGTVIEEPIEVPNELPTLEEFSESIGIWKQNLLEWTKIYPDFHAAYVRAKQLFRDFIVKNGITARYDSRFAMFIAVNDTDLKDSKDVQVNVQLSNITDEQLDYRINLLLEQRQNVKMIGNDNMSE